MSCVRNAWTNVCIYTFFGISINTIIANYVYIRLKLFLLKISKECIYLPLVYCYRVYTLTLKRQG